MSLSIRTLVPALLAAASVACSSGGSPASGDTTTPPGGGGGGGGNPPPPVETKVLFLGNSYTATNSMPFLFEQLAADRGRPVVRAVHAPGGNTLGTPQVNGHPHATDPTSLGLIAADAWDWVVLQEQSITPTVPFTFESYTKPGAASLDAAIHANDPTTRTLLFQTWGRANGGQFCASGDCSPIFADFDQMQDALTAAYAELGQLIGAAVAPVGESWRTLHALDPTMVLHQADGSHPTHEGSYLAACVFYASIFDESPVGIGYSGTVSDADADVLQEAAARAVFEPTCGIAAYGSASGGATAVHSLVLTATGETRYGGTFELAPDAVPEAGWYCLASAADADLPLFGGALLVDPAQSLFGAELLPGTTPASVTIPDDPLVAGLDLYFQALAPDATQPQGFAFSGGVRVEVCP